MTVPLTSRPRILLISSSSGDPVKDEAIKQVADVYHIPGRNYEESITLIKAAVEEHGPFVAFGGLFMLGEKFPMRWDEDLLAPLAPACKLYVGPGAGYDKVDIDWITSTGAYYANSPLTVGQRTADGALMLLLAAARGLTPQDLSIRSGGWTSPSTQSLNWRTLTLGILGLGNIGLQLAQMSSFLGMKIIYSNRSPRNDIPAHFEYVSQEDLWRRSDAIVLTCPLTKETQHLVGQEVLGKMKDGVVLVNVARGGVVDEEALIEALESGKVRRAALDVFENEPSVNARLRSNPNVTLSPHCSAALDAPGPGMNGEVIDNIMEFLQTGSPTTPVNRKQLDATARSPQVGV